MHRGEQLPLAAADPRALQRALKRVVERGVRLFDLPADWAHKIGYVGHSHLPIGSRCRAKMALVPHSAGGESRKRTRAGISCRVIELFFNPQKLVVLSYALAARRGARFDLSTISGYCEVSDCGVLGLT